MPIMSYVQLFFLFFFLTNKCMIVPVYPINYCYKLGTAGCMFLSFLQNLKCQCMDFFVAFFL